MRAIHWPRRRTFKVDCLAIVATTMAGTLKLILARFPIGRAAEMRATRVDHENPIGSLVHPDAVLLLPLRIDTERVIRGKANGKLAGGLENGPWQEKTEKH